MALPFLALIKVLQHKHWQRFLSPVLQNIQNAATVSAAGTYIGGLLFSLLQLLLGVFESLRVLIQLIFGSLQLLLQSDQLILYLSREKTKPKITKMSILMYYQLQFNTVKTSLDYSF